MANIAPTLTPKKPRTKQELDEELATQGPESGLDSKSLLERINSYKELGNIDQTRVVADRDRQIQELIDNVIPPGTEFGGGVPNAIVKQAITDMVNTGKSDPLYFAERVKDLSGGSINSRQFEGLKNYGSKLAGIWKEVQGRTKNETYREDVSAPLSRLEQLYGKSAERENTLSRLGETKDTLAGYFDTENENLDSTQGQLKSYWDSVAERTGDIYDNKSTGLVGQIERANMPQRRRVIEEQARLGRLDSAVSSYNLNENDKSVQDAIADALTGVASERATAEQDVAGQRSAGLLNIQGLRSNLGNQRSNQEASLAATLEAIISGKENSAQVANQFNQNLAFQQSQAQTANQQFQQTIAQQLQLANDAGARADRAANKEMSTMDQIKGWTGIAKDVTGIASDYGKAKANSKNKGVPE